SRDVHCRVRRRSCGWTPAAERAGAGDSQPRGGAGGEERPDREIHGRAARLGGQIQEIGPSNVAGQGV
ncbi:hypothetical protein PPTG_20053, partial [Phytophthora nicotianae INRA-310]